MCSMNWKKLLSISTCNNEAYADYGLYDYSDDFVLGGYLFSNIVTSSDISFYLEDFLSGQVATSNGYLDLCDSIIILCAFCKYVSYDSLFEVFYSVKDSLPFLYNIIRKTQEGIVRWINRGFIHTCGKLGTLKII